MRVTQRSIARVPRIESDVLDEWHWDTLQQKHRELLEYVRDDEIGTEAIAYYDLNMRELTKYKGKPGAASVLPSEIFQPHYVMHSHPDGCTFSIGDVAKFLGDENALGISAVGNDGSLFTLEKRPNYDVSAVAYYFSTVEHEMPDPQKDPCEMVRFMENFCNHMNGCGFIYRKR